MLSYMHTAHCRVTSLHLRYASFPSQCSKREDTSVALMVGHAPTVVSVSTIPLLLMEAIEVHVALFSKDWSLHKRKSNDPNIAQSAWTSI